MMTVQRKLIALANIINVRADRLRTSAKDGDQQVSVFIDAPSGTFRVGYFDGNMFFRENPTTRALWRHGIGVAEGLVGKNSEPQYDMVFHFDNNGNVVYYSDQRTAMEADV